MRSMRLSSLCDDYVAVRLLHAGSHTKLKYRYAIRHFERSLSRPPLIADLTDDSIARFGQYLCEIDLARATVNSYLAHLAALWNFAFRRALTPIGPTFRSLPEIQRVPIALTP